jgi:hypothetical protein
MFLRPAALRLPKTVRVPRKEYGVQDVGRVRARALLFTRWRRRLRRRIFGTGRGEATRPLHPIRLAALARRLIRLHNTRHRACAPSAATGHSRPMLVGRQGPRHPSRSRARLAADLAGAATAHSEAGLTVAFPAAIPSSVVPSMAVVVSAAGALAAGSTGVASVAVVIARGPSASGIQAQPPRANAIGETPPPPPAHPTLV